MNYRRALQLSTTTGLGVLGVMVFGVVLWTADEMLGWNLLPDWIDKYAELLVILLSILAGVSVVVSLMCSLALIAESMAERAGITAPAGSRRVRSLVIGGVVAAAVGMFGLHQVDQYRAGKRADAAEAALEGRMDANLALFTEDMKAFLEGGTSETSEEALAGLLNAIAASMPHRPSVRILVRAESPYAYCVISAYRERRRGDSDDQWSYLERAFLTGFPEEWERQFVEALFAGVPATDGGDDQKRGVFIDLQAPGARGQITRDGRVVGILMATANGF